MKKNQREIYLVLSMEVETTLCTFCKFFKSEWCGDGSCNHTLVDKLEATYGLYKGQEPGDDCWGFRPDISVRDVADIVGIVLSKKFKIWSYEITNKGIKVYGE